MEIQKKNSHPCTEPFESKLLTQPENRTKLGGKFFAKWGKFPFVIKGNEQVKVKVDEQLASVKFQLKKVLCLAVAVGNEDMTEEQIRQNLNLTINFLVSLLKKGWNNIKSLNIKTTMGKPVSLF